MGILWGPWGPGCSNDAWWRQGCWDGLRSRLRLCLLGCLGRDPKLGGSRLNVPTTLPARCKVVALARQKLSVLACFGQCAVSDSNPFFVTSEALASVCGSEAFWIDEFFAINISTLTSRSLDASNSLSSVKCQPSSDDENRGLSCLCFRMPLCIPHWKCHDQSRIEGPQKSVLICVDVC